MGMKFDTATLPKCCNAMLGVLPTRFWNQANKAKPLNSHEG